jgi:beta-galactosidase
VGPGGGFAGEVTGPIQEGKIDGVSVSFRAGSFTYSGSVKGELIELRRSAPPPRPDAAAFTSRAPAGPRPAIGPPPDGTDPSFGAGRFGQGPATLALRRASR